MMDELNALNAPKKVVDGLTEVFEGLAQMFEGVSDQLELLGADAVPEGKRIFPVVDQKAPAVSEKKGSAAPHPRRKPIKKTRKVEEAVDKPEDPVNDSDSDAGADTQLEAENSVGEAEDDHKLEALEDLIEAANGQPVLVAYWFKHDRERIINHLSKLKIKVRDIKSSTDIKDWNAGNIPVALIHPASAGHGLNIQQGGHILIWFGLTWSLELYQQTNARLWRQGQTQVVTIHHIITKDTVDEDVMAALEQKDMTQEKLISAVKAQLGV